MQQGSHLPALLAMLKNAGLMSAGMVVVVGLAGWFEGWTTIFQYGGGMVIAGMTMLVLGIFSGSHQWRRSQVYHLPAEDFSKTSERLDPPSSECDEVRQNFRVAIHFVLMGIAAIFVGSVMQVIFR